MARYTYAPGYIDAVAVQERDLIADDDFGDDDEVVYYHSNTLYSVLALTDADENVIERYRYDAYGACTVLDSDTPSPRLRRASFSADADGLSDVENPYLFTARRLDPETALMQYRHRMYDPGRGRFVSHDPDGYVHGFNLYEYVGNHPVTLADPLGLGFFGDLKRGAQRVGGWTKQGAGWVARRTKRGAQRVGGAVRTGYDKTVQAGVNWALTGKADPTQEELGAGYLGAEEYFGGGDTQVEYGYPWGFEGIIEVKCCDADSRRHVVILKKRCWGLAGGAFASKHVLGNIEGANCPDAYSGYFTEWTAGAIIGVAGFVGTDTTSGRRVTGAGGYLGLGLPLQIMRCHYVQVADDVVGCCD